MPIRQTPDFGELLSNSLAITAAIAWNDAIGRWISRGYPGSADGSSLMRAMFVTVMVLGFYWILQSGRKRVGRRDAVPAHIHD